MREEILYKIAELILEDRINLEEHPIEKVEYDVNHFEVTLGGFPKNHFNISMFHTLDNPEQEFAMDHSYITFNTDKNRWE